MKLNFIRLFSIRFCFIIIFFYILCIESRHHIWAQGGCDWLKESKTEVKFVNEAKTASTESDRISQEIFTPLQLSMAICPHDEPWWLLFISFEE